MLLDHDLVRSYSFVGSPAVGGYIYSRATANLKRAQALVGAKNHMVIMPDANKENVLKCASRRINGSCRSTMYGYFSCFICRSFKRVDS